MQESLEQSQEDTIDVLPYEFHGEIDKLRSILPIIKCCKVKSFMTFSILPSGFKLIAEDDSHSLQSSIFLQKDLFKVYKLTDGKSQIFEVNIDEFLVIVELLFPSENIESSRTFTLNVDRMFITLRDNELYFSVKNGHQQGRASLKTQDLISEVRNISMQAVNRVVLDASVMVDFWNFADLTSSYVYLTFDDDKISFGTKSFVAEADFEIESNSSHIEYFECHQTQTQIYEMKTLKYTAAITKRSSKMCLKMNSAGILNIQAFICLDSGPIPLDSSSFLNSQPAQRFPSPDQTCYVEYFVAPTVDESFV